MQVLLELGIIEEHITSDMSKFHRQNNEQLLTNSYHNEKELD